MSPLVCIQKNWQGIDLLRQTPGHSGRWDGVCFTEDLVDQCDYLVILNGPRRTVSTSCPPEHIWAIMQEPPNEVHSRMHRGRDHYARIYTQDSGLTGSRYIHSQPVLPWHVNRDYDWLISAPVPEKVKQLSWVTSSKTRFKGHRDRMGFLSRIRGSLQFDLYGRGFLEIADKWDGLAPYRYSLAIENYSNPWYWTEKIADCFLTWTMPIYYGCNEISHYFPSESYIQIDIHDPSAIDQVREIISSDLWDNSLGAIHEARKAVLNRHQIFPFLVNEIRENETQIYRIGRRPTQTEVKISTNSLAQRIKKMGLALPRWSHRIMKDLIDSA